MSLSLDASKSACATLPSHIPKAVKSQVGMSKYFVVVSGLPGSGKSTLAQLLAPPLALPVLDKDYFLERLYDSKGIGDLAWRRVLSRESDLLLQAEAMASPAAILVSHWRLPGMPSNSGTPTAWISGLSDKVVNVHCECDAKIAADRLTRRKRHPGHLDELKSPAEILASLQAIAHLGGLNIFPRVDVDTSQTPDLNLVLSQVHSAFEQAPKISAIP
jgi:predicted kinase